nr:hypothetical protein [Candidimonas nitroreducens]
MAKVSAADLDIPRNAHFVAEYAKEREPRRPAMDDTLIMEPFLALRMTSAAIFIPRKQPN